MARITYSVGRRSNQNNQNNTNNTNNTNNANANTNSNNNAMQSWLTNVFNSIKTGDRNNISNALKTAPASIKKVTGVLDLATTAVSKSIIAIKKLVKAFEDSAEKFRKVTNLSVKNSTADKTDTARAEAIEHVNSIKASLDQLKNNIDSFVLSLAGMLKNYEEWWTNTWNNRIGKLVPALKIDQSSLDNSDAQSTALQRDTSLQSAINSARAGGADNRTAEVMGGKVNSLISKLMNSAKDGITYESMADAVHKAVFSGDANGFEQLGFDIDDYNLKAMMYKQGFDVSGNTKYMDSALAGGRLSALEKLIGLTDAQLQEMTQQGLVLDNINQNFAWESVEALSTVNTDAGHYDKSGGFIVEGVKEALEETGTKLSDTIKANSNGNNYAVKEDGNGNFYTSISKSTSTKTMYDGDGNKYEVKDDGSLKYKTTILPKSYTDDYTNTGIKKVDTVEKGLWDNLEEAWYLDKNRSWKEIGSGLLNLPNDIFMDIPNFFESIIEGFKNGRQDVHVTVECDTEMLKTTIREENYNANNYSYTNNNSGYRREPR